MGYESTPDGRFIIGFTTLQTYDGVVQPWSVTDHESVAFTYQTHGPWRPAGFLEIFGDLCHCQDQLLDITFRFTPSPPKILQVKRGPHNSRHKLTSMVIFTFYSFSWSFTCFQDFPVQFRVQRCSQLYSRYFSSWISLFCSIRSNFHSFSTGFHRRVAAWTPRTPRILRRFARRGGNHRAGHVMGIR